MEEKIVYPNQYPSTSSYSNLQGANSNAGMSVSLGPTEQEIPREMKIQSSTVETLHQRLSSLEERLSPVISSNAPVPSVKNGEMKIISPLASAIYSNTTKIENAIERINSMMSRLHI